MAFLFRFIVGYVRFSFSGGFAETFLNSCFEKGLAVRKISKTQEGIEAICSPSTYKNLHSVAIKSGGKVRIKKKVGLPFLIPSIRYRLGFFVGFFVFTIIIMLLNSFVWNVEIVGNDKVSSASILYYLEDNGVKVGCPWSSFDRSRLSWQMLSDFDDLAWVHINKEGANAVVEVSESTAPDTDYDENRLKGIGAFRVEINADAMREQSQMRLRKSENYYKLNFFGMPVPLYIKEEYGDVTSTLNTPIKIHGVTLPISLETTTQSFYEALPYSLEDEELEALAIKKLELKRDSELSEYEIVNESVNVEISEDRAEAKGNYVVRIMK